MVKTKDSTRRDVITRVRRQHDTIRRLFDDVQSAAPGARAEAFQPLVRLLAVHETAEEMVVYPAVMLTGADGRAVVRARKEEENRAKKDLAGLEGVDAGSREFLDRLHAFRAEVEAHAEAEEVEVLPLLDERRAAHELRVMDRAFVTAQWIAPTHAHRFAPESAIGNLLLGPPVAVVDRMRDLLTNPQPARRPRSSSAGA
jgi:hemerythrin superfamily protein